MIYFRCMISKEILQGGYYKVSEQQVNATRCLNEKVSEQQGNIARCLSSQGITRCLLSKIVFSITMPLISWVITSCIISKGILQDDLVSREYYKVSDQQGDIEITRCSLNNGILLGFTRCLIRKGILQSVWQHGKQYGNIKRYLLIHIREYCRNKAARISYNVSYRDGIWK